jgi:hypothetical protein
MTAFTIDTENHIQAVPNAEPAEVAAGEGRADLCQSEGTGETGGQSRGWSKPGTVFAGVPLDHLKPLKRFTDRTTACTASGKPSRDWRRPRNPIPLRPQGAQRRAQCQRLDEFHHLATQAASGAPSSHGNPKCR